MAVDNTTLIIIIGLFFNYFIVYNKNKFFGNILYILFGMGIFYFGSSMTGINQNITIMTGILIFVGSMINFIYDLFYNNTKTNKLYTNT